MIMSYPTLTALHMYANICQAYFKIGSYEVHKTHKLNEIKGYLEKC